MQFPVSRTRLGRLTLATLLITAILAATFYGTNFFKAQTPKIFAATVAPVVPVDFFHADNMATWLTSNQPNYDAAWSTMLWPLTYSDIPLQQLVDLNGDGLLDFVYVKHSSNGTSQNAYELVMLNNGHGWDITFKCNQQRWWGGSAYIKAFTGDCAQTN